MAHATDRSGIQFRVLNGRKGPAVRATRVQADRVLYRNAIRSALEHAENVEIFQDSVEDIHLENDCVAGVVTRSGIIFQSAAIVLTAGTFLNGKMHVGIDAFIAIWRNLPRWRLLAFVCGISGIRFILSKLYNVFADWKFARSTHCKMST